jgi:hypothetical protein
MDFQKLKNQIKETQKLIETEIDMSSPSRAALEIRKNQAVRNFEELKKLEKNMLHMHSNLYLVTGATEQIAAAFEKQGCLVGDHNHLAKKVANRFWPQFNSGMSLNSFIVEQINQYMDTLCMDIGLDTALRPRLVMQTAFQNALQTEDQLADTLAQMFETQLKNTATEEEAHVLQALMTATDLVKRYESMDKSGQNVTFVVSVPRHSANLLDAYKGILSANVYTAAFKNDLSSDDKKVNDTVKSVLKKKEVTV